MNGLSVHFLDGIIRADFGTGTAVRALLLIDDKDGISLRDAFHGTFLRAVSTSVAFFGDQIRHLRSPF